MKKWLSIFALLHLCCSAQTLEAGSVTRVSNSILRIQGILTPAVSQQFKDLVSSEIKLVQVSSEGGVTESGLEIAEEIQRMGLDVEIEDFCASSCANYIFIAGNNKIIKPGAVIGWHGGHSFTPFRPRIDSTQRLEEKKILLQREQLLYARAGVSIDLVVYSGLVTVGMMKDGLVRRDYSLWCPSYAEMTRLGIKNLKFDSSWDNSKAIEDRLTEMGFAGQKVYAGNAYSYIPEAFLVIGI